MSASGDLGNGTATGFNRARLWRDASFGGLDLLTASFVSHRFVPHAHEEYVIAVYETGAEAFVCAGKPNVAAAGSVLIICPGEVHSGCAAMPEGWQYRAFYPSQRGMEEIWRAASGMVQLPRLETRLIADATLAATLSRAHRLLERGANRLQRELELVAGLTELIGHFGTKHAPRGLSGENWKLKRAKHHIEDAFSEEVRLSDLVEVSGLSAGYLTRLFHQHYGLPPHAYLTQIRLNKAKELLRRGETQAQTASATGFSDQSHFVKQFKRAFGVTPGAYGREVRKIQYPALVTADSGGDPGCGRRG